jgi:hypothetical protein
VSTECIISDTLNEYLGTYRKTYLYLQNQKSVRHFNKTFGFCS